MPSVTAGDLRRRIQSSLGDPSATFITTPDCYDWIMDAQHQISKITECLTSDISINSVANTERYTLDNQILKALRVTYDNSKLHPITIDHLDSIDPNRDVAGNNGLPTHYYIDGGSIGLWPKPATSLASGIRIRARVLATDTIDADGDVLSIPDYFREDVIRYALIKGREKDESPEFIAILMQDWHDKIAISKAIANNQEDRYQVVRDIESQIDYATDWTW